MVLLRVWEVSGGYERVWSGFITRRGPGKVSGGFSEVSGGFEECLGRSPEVLIGFGMVLWS